MQNLITVELICAASGGLIGAVLTLVSNDKKETFVEGTLAVVVGIVFGAGAGTKWAGDPIWSCLLGIIAGSVAGTLLEGLRKHAPEVLKAVLFGWVEKIGGKKDVDEK